MKPLIAFLLPFLALLVLPWYVGYLDCAQGTGSSNTIAVCTLHRMGWQETAVMTWSEADQKWLPWLEKMDWK